MSTETQDAAAAPPTIKLNIRRLPEQTVEIQVPNTTTVPDLKICIQSEISVEPERQRLIYRGRVMKNDKSIQDYGIVDGDNIHLVERPAESSNQPSTPAASSHDTFPLRPLGGSVGNPAGVIFHTMEIDPSQGPQSIAAQLTQSIMGSLSNSFAGAFGGSAASDSGSSAQGATAANTSSSTRPATSIPVSIRSAAPRSIPRTTLSPRTDTISGHQMVRSPTSTILPNLTKALREISFFSNGSPIIPHPVSSTAASTAPSANSISETLAAYQSVFSMLAHSTERLSSEMAGGSIEASSPHLQSLQNTISLLQEMPVLMIVLRRLLASVRTRPDPENPGSVILDIPPNMDVPAFLTNSADPSSSDTTNDNNNHVTMDIEPPE